jgi:hypothetical protein
MSATMSKEIVETLSGVARLFDGGRYLGHVPYSMVVTHEVVEMRELGGDDTVTTFEMHSTGGRLFMQNDILGLDSNSLLLRDLRLVLEDGRRARIIIQSASVQTGHCVFGVKGSLETA